QRPSDHPALHSSPTRRSSDLIYYHFASRDEIMRAVLESGIEEARGEVMQAIAAAGPHSVPLARLRAALGAHLKFTLRAHFSSRLDRKSTRLNSSHLVISYAVF